MRRGRYASMLRFALSIAITIWGRYWPRKFLAG
ncbi:cytochrome b6-f complex subunit PetN [Sulfitobacter indolifex]